VPAQAEPHEQCVLIRDLEIGLRHWGGPVGRLVWRWRLRQRPWGSRSARCRRDVDRIGLAYRDGFVLVLVADQEGIWRVPDISGSVRAGRPDQPKITDVPPEQRKPVPAAYGQELITPRGVFGVIAGHQNRHLALDPQTGAMFVGVGSSGNIGVEPEVKASILRFEPDGSGQTTFSSGMRNPTTLAFHPSTGELYAGVQERDGLGDNLPPDYLTRVEKGAFYGWPYAYIGPNPQPGFAHRAPEKVKATVVPDVLFQAHSSVLDLVFYDGEQFPAEYRGDAFVALKGSWNRSEPTGYKVVRVRFKDGRPEGSCENCVTGFRVLGQHRAEPWERRTGVIDGAWKLVGLHADKTDQRLATRLADFSDNPVRLDPPVGFVIGMQADFDIGSKPAACVLRQGVHPCQRVGGNGRAEPLDRIAIVIVVRRLDHHEVEQQLPQARERQSPLRSLETTK
jgi:hypothetical protein